MTIKVLREDKPKTSKRIPLPKIMPQFTIRDATGFLLGKVLHFDGNPHWHDGAYCFKPDGQRIEMTSKELEAIKEIVDKANEEFGLK